MIPSFDTFIANRIAKAGSIDFENPTAIAEAALIERMNGNQVRVHFDFSEFFSNRLPSSADSSDGIEQMVAAALAGHSFVFRVQGPRIIETTGLLSDDKRSARHVLPMTLVMAAEPDFGTPFITVVELKN